MKIMQHQKEALDFLAERPSGGLFFEMGLGKTFTMLTHLDRMVKGNDEPFPCLIVCPLSVVSVWENEVEKFGFDFRVKKLTGTYNQRLTKLGEDADIYVVNYEGMRILGGALEMKRFRTIILDEAHRIKERSSQQTTIAMALAQRALFRYILTGTPVTKSPEDLWTQMQFVEPGSLGNFWAFRNRYIDFRTINVRMPGGMKEIKKAVKFKNLPELEERISKHCLRRTKAECLDLPEKIYKTVPCEFSKEQSKAYYELKHSLAADIQNDTITVSTAAAALQKMQQVCQGFIYDEAKEAKWLGKNVKLDMLKDLLIDIGENKVIIFTWFKADVEKLYEELSKTHRVLRYGGNADERGDIVREFQSSADPIIFLAQIETAKEGITLTVGNHVIYYGNSWSYGTRVQSEDRAHRVGQRGDVIYYDMVITGSVDEYVQATLARKGALADKVTGDSIRLAKLVCGLEEIE